MDADAVKMAQLRLQAQTVARVHGPEHPAMRELAGAVEALLDAPPADRAEVMARVRALTDGYRPWPEACRTVRSLYAGLAGLDRG